MSGIENAKLARDLEQAFNDISSSMMSNNFAAKLLAYVYVMGGGNEVVTHNTALNAGINIAQQKFNLYGSEMPKVECLELLRKFVKDLENSYKDGKYTAGWLREIEGRYNLKLLEVNI